MGKEEFLILIIFIIWSCVMVVMGQDFERDDITEKLCKDKKYDFCVVKDTKYKIVIGEKQ